MTDTISEQPTVELTAFTLSGEPTTDRGFITANGTRIRVRFLPLNVQKSDAPVNGDVAVQAIGKSYSITISHLDEADEVIADASGAFEISGIHSVTIHELSLQNPDFVVSDFIMATIKQCAAKFEAMLANKAALASFETDWLGGSSE